MQVRLLSKQKERTSGISWTTLFKFAVAFSATISSILAGAIVVGLGYNQWRQKPIAIGMFVDVRDADKYGISAGGLADQLKAQISQINAESGDLFESRKLVDNAIPLDIKIGNTGWTFATLTKAFNWQFTSAVVSGRISQVGNHLILQFTTALGDRIQEDQFPISLPASFVSKSNSDGRSGGESDKDFLEDVHKSIACLALRIVKSVSQDVAANFLHKQDESGDKSADAKARTNTDSCIHRDDVDLYSEVAIDRLAPVAARVNALVGLSVHYSQTNQRFEELNMALAATKLASVLLRCEDRSWWDITCAFQRREKNNRAQVAAWMQLGAAYSDYAIIAPTLFEANSRRGWAVVAYRHVLAVNSHYALAWDGMGLQFSNLKDTANANAAYKKSIDLGETAPAQIDLGLESIHGRDDIYAKLRLSPETLKDAEDHFQQAIYLKPNYWDAHGRLGYVLYGEGRFAEAADALEVALYHDSYNRHLRRLLASVLARMCRFDQAKQHYVEARQAAEKEDDLGTSKGRARSSPRTHANSDVLNLQADWGRALEEFRLYELAVEQESAVLEVDPKHVDALVYRGLMQIKNAGKKPELAETGLADLKAAFQYDSTKSKFVLEAYLVSLLQLGHAHEAVKLYQHWADEKYVPMPAKRIEDVSSLPPDQELRSIYANALYLDEQLEDSEEEIDVLTRVGTHLEPGSDNLRLHAGGSVGDEDEEAIEPACKVQLSSQTPRLKDVSIMNVQSKH
jgi:tetratricopeptide (TPR) repeat protein